MFFLSVTLNSLLNSLNSRLCEWTCRPGLISSNAKPIISSYLMIGAPFLIVFKQTLCPKGIGSIVLSHDLQFLFFQE